MTEDNKWAENEAKTLLQKDKWAQKLGSQCGISDAFLKDVLDELSESCYGDARTSRSIIEELTLTCHMNEADLKRFMADISKNCPYDAKTLQEQVTDAKGNKDLVFKVFDKAGPKRVFERDGVR